MINMREIIISTPSVKSKITCGKGALEAFLPEIAEKKVMVITDSNVARLYGGLIEKSFAGAPVCVIPAGEKSKNYNRLKIILKTMLDCGLTRSSTVIALGGGVVGDISGLAASLYMRGIKIVQIPTTLLSQVDSSVGGKTAVDFCGVKNAVGTFYQPYRVVVDPLFLKTLPAREIRCGLGEIVKYAALDSEIYSILKACGNLFDLNFLETVVAPCIDYKAKVVTEDEKETTGARKALNLGHTTGHAFELYYKRKSHGEFVLIGMYYELFIARKKGVINSDYAESLEKLIKKVIKIPAYADAAKAATQAKYDKKNTEQSTISMIVPVREGEHTEIKLPANEYGKVIAECAEYLRSENV